jgi:hypothetical protein
MIVSMAFPAAWMRYELRSKLTVIPTSFLCSSQHTLNKQLIPSAKASSGLVTTNSMASHFTSHMVAQTPKLPSTFNQGG